MALKCSCRDFSSPSNAAGMICPSLRHILALVFQTEPSSKGSPFSDSISTGRYMIEISQGSSRSVNTRIASPKEYSKQVGADKRRS